MEGLGKVQGGFRKGLRFREGCGKVLGRLWKVSGKVQGRFRESSWKVQYREGLRKVQGR